MNTNDALWRAAGLHVQRLGQGSSELVLLHGWGMHSAIWEPLLEPLARRFRLTLVDLPGHGYSRALPLDGDLAALAARLAGLVPGPAHWLGWSLGGLIAQQLAADRPDQVRQLVLLASSPCFVRRTGWPHAMTPQVLEQFGAELAADYRATLKRFIALEVHGSEGASATLRWLTARLFAHGEPDSGALRQGLELLKSGDLRPQLGEIRCPTLWLMGRRDALVPAAAAAAAAALMPAARVHVVERGGHAPFLSHAGECLAVLQDFLDD
ncbi:MAG TPA: pimeloyl-ACP methyl ester esterase BioH [Candidatus Competibacteraceae bacterium]|nr:pimeloyl-ACP methyl ester esterase BioH [Candidatus Competibacteraceae bacterium]